MRTILVGILAGLFSAAALARPLPHIATYLTNPTSLNRAVRQLTALHATRPRERPMIVTLTLNQPTISFVVNSASLYNSGVTLASQNTLAVADNIGTGTYVLTVRANSPNLTSGVNTIPVSQVTIQLVNIAGAAYAGPVITLSTTAQTLSNYPYTGAAFTGQQLYLTYVLKPGAAIMKPAGTYSTAITYTITGP